MIHACWLLLGCCAVLAVGHREARDLSRKKEYQIQSGPCTYTFLLPEQDNCPEPAGSLQRDEPAEHHESVQRLEQLETGLENTTRWLLKVINQTSRLEQQLRENSLFTNKLEEQILLQTNEMDKLSKQNTFLEKRVEEMEERRQVELKSLKEERAQLKELVLRQTAVIKELEQQLNSASSNNSALQRQQHHLLETVNTLISTITVPTLKASAMVQDAPEEYVDCAAAFKAGKTQSGVYSLTSPNSTNHIKAYCDMETLGGGWTVFQKRFKGEVDFHRTWEEYKTGFGDPASEHWLGNEFVSQLTNGRPYIMRIQLEDWEGNSGFSQYDSFTLSSEAENYRIQLTGYSGTAGKISSLGQPGSGFSTKDADNDKCVCKCSQLTTGGWWFDACGPSNLNGIYYQKGLNTNRFNGIKWYYWKGSGYSLKATQMMIRPADF